MKTISLVWSLFLGVSLSAQVNLKLPCEFGSQTISQTGKYVAVRCKDESVHLLEVPAGREISGFPAAGRFVTLAFSKDDNMFAAGSLNGDVAVIPLGSPTTHKQWHAADGGIDALAFGPRNTIAVAPHGQAGEVWDLTGTPERRATLDDDFDSLTSVAVSPDGNWLVTTGGDTVVRFYQTSTWNMTGEYRGYTLEPFTATFTKDSKNAIVAGADGQVTLFDPATAKPERTVSAHTDPIVELHVIDSNHIALISAEADGHKLPRLEVWDINNGKTKIVDTDKEVTGGGIVDGKIWLARGSGNRLGLSVGQ